MSKIDSCPRARAGIASDAPARAVYRSRERRFSRINSPEISSREAGRFFTIASCRSQRAQPHVNPAGLHEPLIRRKWLQTTNHAVHACLRHKCERRPQGTGVCITVWHDCNRGSSDLELVEDLV